MSGDVGAEVDPLALALFGVRDHVRHHHGCTDRRGIGGHHYDADDECALRDIIERYADRRVEAAKAEALLPIRELADDWERTAPLCSDEEESVRRLLVSQLRAVALDPGPTDGGGRG